MRKILLATTGLMAAFGAHAQSIQSGTIGGMPYQVLMPAQACTAQNPCSVVTYLGYQNSTFADATRDLNNYFGTGAFQSASHSVVIAPTIPGSQDATVDWGGYNTATTPQQAQMVAVVKGVEAQLGNAVNPANSVVTGGSLGGNGTQAALISYGPRGQKEPGVFSAGLSFDAADWPAASNPASAAAALCGVPLTAVHGVEDSNQLISFDQNLQKAVNSNPACNNSFTLMPIQNAGHGTWSGPSGYRAGVGSGTPLGWLTSQMNSAPTPPAPQPQQPTQPAAPMPVSPPAPGQPAAPTSPGPLSVAAFPTEITPDSGALTDCKGDPWMITASGSIMEGERYVPGGGGTSALAVIGCKVYGKDSGHGPVNPGGWFQLSGDGQSWSPSGPPPNGVVDAQPPPPGQPDPHTPIATNPPLPEPTSPCTTAPPNFAASAGGFATINGQIYSPNGTPFIARGINIRSNELSAVTSGQVTSAFPGINFVRVNIRSLENPASLAPAVNYLTAKGIVVELEDHPDGGGDQDAWSSQPGDVNWYAQAAGYFKNNPYVWFGSFNEPAPNNLTAWQQATYQAIRGAGNNNPILMEASGSRPNNLDTALASNVYANMTNVIADPHSYNYQAGYSADQGTVNASVQAMIAATQRLKSADGIMPVIIGEYGDSTDGSHGDAGGSQQIHAVINSGVGSAAWSWICAGADCLQSGGGLTGFGQAVANFTKGSDNKGCAQSPIADAQKQPVTAPPLPTASTVQTAPPLPPNPLSVAQVAALAANGNTAP